MAVTINASTSAGLISTADTSGVLQLQTANTTAVTVNANQTVSLAVGTANGVTYLNGSKVLTSGSALTFDGNTLTAINTSGNAIVASRGSKDLRLSGNYAGANTHAVISTTTGMALAFMDESAEYMRLTSTGLGIGTSSPAYKLDVAGTVAVPNLFDNGGSVRFKYSSTNAASRDWRIVSDIANYGDFGIQQSTTQGGSTFDTKLMFSSTGNLGLGVTPSAWSAYKAIQFGSNGSVANSGGTTLVGWNSYYDGSNYKYIVTGQASQMLISPTGGGGFAWYNAASGTAGNAITFTQPMTLDASGNLLVGTTNTNPGGADINGIAIRPGNFTVISALGTTPFGINRGTDDGTLINLSQAGSTEGTISVSGTTVSYNGGHLSRWAQMLTKPELFKGTVLSNLDEMNVYTKDGQPVDNEQLNKVKVSDTEGDVNVAGVFVNWSHDEDHNVDEINMAMTGDMIIRIAQGVTVVRGDLLMSAGDGTAKPQGDDIIRSKTVAKVTSNHVTCTYADGSYCVPCVLMAC